MNRKLKFESPRLSSPATESINEPNVGRSAATAISTCALYPSQPADAITGNGSNNGSNLLTIKKITKMKKLKKFTIDEIEQNFTTIARQDLQYYVGGSGGGSGSSESGTIDYCECLKVKDRTYLSDAEKLDLLDDIAKMAGIRYEVSLTTMASNIYGQSHPNGSWIAINANSELWKTGNLFDLALVMIHEQNHLDTPDDAGTNSSECDANKAVKDSIYFGYGSPYYKDQVDKSVSKYCK